jgi:hypothetical protein
MPNNLGECKNRLIIPHLGEEMADSGSVLIFLCVAGALAGCKTASKLAGYTGNQITTEWQT